MFVWLSNHRRKLTAVLLVAVPLFFLVTSAGASVGSATTSPGRWAGGVLGTAQATLHGVIGDVGGLWRRITGGDRDDETFEEMRREVERLREEKTRLLGVLQENARLREMVGFQVGRPDLEMIPGKVIARDISPFFRVIKIRIRADQELAPRMPVVSAQGVVGQIHKVYEGYADVVLVSDPRSRIDAISQRNRAMGMVEGLGHEADYQARIAYLRDHDEVRVGDRMVTSGMGGIFPRELIIGDVIEVHRDKPNLFQQILIEPAVDFARLEEVFVIVNAQ